MNIDTNTKKCVSQCELPIECRLHD